VIDRGLAREIESVERVAWSDAFAAAPPLAASALGLAAREVAGAFLAVAPGIESLLFNRAIGLGVERPATDAGLDAMLAHVAGQGAGFAVNLSPFAAPDDLPSRLAARGLASPLHHLKWTRDVRELRPATAASLRLERVKPRDGRAFGRVAAEVFAGGLLPACDWLAATVGRPGWTHYVSYDGEEPAGCGTLFAYGEAAWLGWGATREPFRRRGSMALLLAAAVRDAAAAGCRWVSADSGPDWPDADTAAVRGLRRAGFAVAYERPCWIRA
jgi:GNAT superfamily N-acetyltransferase